MVLKNLQIVPVILSGGAGTRLWPASRESHPKPFMELADGQTLIEKAYRRARAINRNVVTVTNGDYYFMSLEEARRADVSSRFILEPTSRNTAAAIGLAAHCVKKWFGDDAVMLVLASDHLIENQDEFQKAVQNAATLASEGHLVAFGIVPDRPETGFGYIERGNALSLGYKVKSFVEKPDLLTAIHYLESGSYFWNAGMFCFKASALLDALLKLSPAVARPIEDCFNEVCPIEGADVIDIPDSGFSRVPDISIDFAVFEKSDDIAVVPGTFGWSDIGSWGAVSDLISPDKHKNRAVGEVVFVDTENTFVQSENRLVALVGVKDLMVVDTPDALLIANSSRSQDVRKVVEKLKLSEHEALRMHKTVSRPWGTYTVLEEGRGFKIKRIEVKPGASLSLQMHHRRSEHWVVVSGIANILNGDKRTTVRANESTYIPAGQKHRLENPGASPCVMIEVQCGMYLGEDDIVRFEDNYGRG